jgi:hypothetical protein
VCSGKSLLCGIFRICNQATMATQFLSVKSMYVELCECKCSQCSFFQFGNLDILSCADSQF